MSRGSEAERTYHSRPRIGVDKSLISPMFQKTKMRSHPPRRNAALLRRLLPGAVTFMLLFWLIGTLATAAAASPLAGRQILVRPGDSGLAPRQLSLQFTVTPTPVVTVTERYTLLLPLLFAPVPPLPPPLPPPLIYSATAPLDFAAVITDLQSKGLELAYNKIGFHTGIDGNIEGLNQWMTELDAAGVPIFLKSADNAEPLYNAQQLMKASGVDHTLIFRRTGNGYDVPDYKLTPQQAAANHWALHMAAWPPELDPSLVWIETINEVDKGEADWLGQFALETAKLALADGFRWAAFGWSSGEPEPSHWGTPGMVQFLKLAAEHPDQLAVAVHEYSYLAEEIGRWYPYLLGRFQALFHSCDIRGITRPTVLITEWGWEYDHVPAAEAAMADIAWASWLYAAYPQVKGAAIWYLGGNFGGIADEAQLLISPLREYSLSHYFGYTPGLGAIDAALFQPASVP